MSIRAPVRGFSGWNWFFFDCLFKPALVCSVVVLERWFSWRVKIISTASELKIGAMDAVAHRILGPTTAAFICSKTMRLVVYFCEVDTAYSTTFDAWIEEYQKRKKERWVK